MQIPDAVLETARAANADAMPDVFIILERTLEDDGYGGKVESWNETAEVKGRLVFAGNNPRNMAMIEGAGIKAHEAYTVSLEYGAGAVETNRIQRKDADDVYDIVTAIDERSYQMADRFLVKRV